MYMTPYALAHIDGELDCATIKTGIFETWGKRPTAFFQVIAGLQRHPVWAMDRLAAEVYCYSQAATKNGLTRIEINVIADLVSGNWTTCPLASRIIWHTSSKVRTQAEAMVTTMIGKEKDIGHGRSCPWVDRWPAQESMKMPVTGPLLDR